MARGLLLVFSNAKDAESADEFSQWYDDVHIPEVLQLEEVVAATRYRIDDSMREISPVGPFLAIYEIEADPLTDILGSLQAAMTSGAMRTTDLAQEDPPATVLLFQPLGNRRTGDATT